MHSGTLVAALSVIVFAGGLAAAAPAPDPADASAPDPTPPKTIWQIGADGTAVNPQSQLQCPTTVGEFHRTRLNAYGPFGADVSCDYLNTDRDEITLYIALTPQQTLEQQFNAAKAAVTQRLPNASPLPDAEQQTFMSKFDWQHVIFRLSAASHTGLWMTKLGGWNVQFRATFAASRTDTALETMGMLTDTVDKTAGQHIEACSKLMPLQRNGQKIMTQTVFPALSISGMLAAKTARETPASANANWCIIQPIMVQNIRYIFWRNAGEQTNGIVERITPMSENDPITVYGIIDTVWPQMMIKDDDKPKLAYDIVVDTPDAVQLVGVYEGHPPIGELVRIAQSRTVALYGQMDKKDGKVNVYRPPL